MLQRVVAIAENLRSFFIDEHSLSVYQACLAREPRSVLMDYTYCGLWDFRSNKIALGFFTSSLHRDGYHHHKDFLQDKGVVLKNPRGIRQGTLLPGCFAFTLIGDPSSSILGCILMSSDFGEIPSSLQSKFVAVLKQLFTGTRYTALEYGVRYSELSSEPIA